jgi:hypothetical protein
LSGTTSLDPPAATFSFSLNPGSTYLGQAISDSVQGQFDPGTGSYDWTDTGSSGLGFKWSASGTITPLLVDLGKPKWELKSFGKVYTLLSNPPKYIYGQTDKVTLVGPTPTSPAVSIRQTSLADPGGNGLGISIGTDTYDPKTGRWQYEDDFVPEKVPPGPRRFNANSTGITPIAGGAGTYTLTLSPAPEPSTWITCLVGALSLVGYAQCRRPRAANAPTACRTV